MQKKYIALPLFLLSACTVGPDYHTPDVKLPASWISSDKPVDEQAAIEQEWWKRFDDPVLDELIDKAIAGNFDLKIAEAHIAGARAEFSSAQTGLLPTGGIETSAERQGNRIAFPGPLDLTKPFNTFQTGFDASWELDLFGGRRRAIEAGGATLAASEASRDDVQVSLLAEVARTYVSIRQYQIELDIAKDAAADDEKAVAITKERFAVGAAAGMDVKQAAAQAEQSAAEVPHYQDLVSRAELAMDVLLGENPGTVQDMIGEGIYMPVFDGDVILNSPAAVIANRPDIRVAERNLAAATAVQGEAVAKFFPDISLSGFFGLLNLNSSELLHAQSKSWDASGGVMLPILNYGTLSANLHAADAKQQEALATYQKTIIAALSDVERSIEDYKQSKDHRTHLKRAADNDENAVGIAQMRYKQGTSSLLKVLDAKRTFYAAQLEQTDADALYIDNLIAVYKSLGGGWQ